jgi:hypothetical protein
MTNAATTSKEVRAAHKVAGNKVRISNDGNVTFRPEGTSKWLEGRWVEDYQRNYNGKVLA